MKERKNVKRANEFAARAGWQAGRALSVGLPLILIGMATFSYIEALNSPVVMKQAGGAVQGGRVEQVAVRLSDPSLLDRLVASLPALTILLGAGLALGYLAWSNNQRTHRVHGQKETKATRNIFGLCGFIVVVTSVSTDGIGKRYFDGQLVFDAWMVSLAVGVIALVVLESVDSKGRWNREHERAEVLDKKMQDVV